MLIDFGGSLVAVGALGVGCVSEKQSLKEEPIFRRNHSFSERNVEISISSSKTDLIEGRMSSKLAAIESWILVARFLHKRATSHWG